VSPSGSRRMVRGADDVCKRGSKLRLKVGNTFAAREDARPPSPGQRVIPSAHQGTDNPYRPSNRGNTGVGSPS
jgi:hypothetical protein